MEPIDKAFDEMASGRGQLRPHWRSLMATVWSTPAAQFAEKQVRADSHLAEADEFIAIYGQENARPGWSIDLLPLILPQGEWQALAAGLAQRARLLDLILADLYGSQRLVHDRRLPPHLVYANPGFLRPLRSVPRVGGAPHLHFYAADLLRLPSGEWRVWADRTQAPAGVGYALRNRRVLARTFPEAFRSTPVRRLQPFVELWQASLRRIGASLCDDPRIVLLTPGPYNETYFEHVYIARELGITLAQGADLTVRDNGVYLKTLDGLSRVDVIYRRLDGEYSDPLELREDSALGVAGLVEAARAGKVAILNMPGTALVETPAFAPFLPALARTLLSEELKLPAVTTWWCGQKAALDAVLSDVGRYLFRPAFDPDPVPIDPHLLDAGQRAAFEARLAAAPHEMVALERVVPGVAPCLRDGSLSPQPIMLRVSLVWSEGDWVPLPGGMARVIADGALYRNPLRHGGIAKDVWVLTGEEQEVPARAELRPAYPSSRRVEAALQSRAADDLYWLGRGVERLDAGARLLRATFNRLAGGGLGPRDMAELARLTRALARSGWIGPAVAGAPVDGTMFAAGLMAAAGGTGPVGEGIVNTRRLAFNVRDRLSLEMWHTLNRSLGVVRGQLDAAGRDIDRYLAALDELIRAIAAFAGLAAENMTRGAGWRCLDLGRRIERGIAIAQAVRGVMEGPSRQIEIGMRLALELCDSTITHRMRYPTEPRSAHALELVLADTGNPRALLYQLVRARGHLDALVPAGPIADTPRQVSRLIDSVADFPLARLDLDRATIDIRPMLDMLGDIVGTLMSLSDEITRGLFTHVPQTRALRSAAPFPAMDTPPP